MSLKKKVYICSSLRPEVHARVTKILAQLPEAIHLRPYIEQIGNKMGHIESDIAMIYHADEIWVLNEYGRDCSVEIGLSLGIKKPIKIFRDADNAARLDGDWMWNHGVNIGLVEVLELDEEIRREAIHRAAMKAASE